MMFNGLLKLINDVMMLIVEVRCNLNIIGCDRKCILMGDAVESKLMLGSGTPDTDVDSSGELIACFIASASYTFTLATSMGTRQFKHIVSDNPFPRALITSGIYCTISY
jgi:hypothetical protein